MKQEEQVKKKTLKKKLEKLKKKKQKESYLTLNRNLERQVRRLQRDVNFLYNKINTFEEVNARWGKKKKKRKEKKRKKK